MCRSRADTDALVRDFETDIDQWRRAVMPLVQDVGSRRAATSKAEALKHIVRTEEQFSTTQTEKA